MLNRRRETVSLYISGGTNSYGGDAALSLLGTENISISQYEQNINEGSPQYNEATHVAVIHGKPQNKISDSCVIENGLGEKYRVLKIINSRRLTLLLKCYE